MNTLANVKTEIKRGLLPFLAAAAVILPLFGISLYQQLNSCAYTSASSLTGLAWITTPIIRISLELNVIWVILLVLAHYSKDSTVFDDSLPHSNKKMILSKGFAALIITAAVSLCYFAVSAYLCFKYRWLLSTMYWCMRQTSVDSFDFYFMALMSATIFAFCTALYWYAALCCSVSRSAASGFVLAVLGALALISFVKFLSYMGYDAAIIVRLKNCLKGTAISNYALCTLILALSVLLLLICAPAAISLYGGGKSSHPFFRYGGAAAAAMLFITAACAFYVPTKFDSRDINIPVTAVLSGVLGFAASFAANMAIAKKKSKKGDEEK